MCIAYLSWYSHRNGFHFPFMEFVKPTEDQEISNLTILSLNASYSNYSLMLTVALQAPSPIVPTYHIHQIKYIHTYIYM